MYMLIPGAIKSFENVNIVWRIIVGIFVVKFGDSFSPEIFIVASLCYYVLTIIFIALE